MHPAKTQISLSIHLVWSESSLWAQGVAKDPAFLHKDSELWSDCADAQADPSLAVRTGHFVGFVMPWLSCKKEGSSGHKWIKIWEKKLDIRKNCYYISFILNSVVLI